MDKRSYGEETCVLQKDSEGEKNKCYLRGKAAIHHRKEQRSAWALVLATMTRALHLSTKATCILRIEETSIMSEKTQHGCRREVLPIASILHVIC